MAINDEVAIRVDSVMGDGYFEKFLKPRGVQTALVRWALENIPDNALLELMRDPNLIKPRRI